MTNPMSFRYFKTSPEIIQLAVMLYVRFPLSLRNVGDLDLNTDRLRVAEDEITKYNHERLNNNMYRLSILSAVFLPLGFLTGLLDVNIAGVPGVSSPSAFIVFCALLLVIFGLQLLILKRLKWF
jgi:zinc transporter